MDRSRGLVPQLAIIGACMKEVATVALINVRSKKMLMGKRRDNLKWTTPGGHLDPGEDPVDGAVREVKEETGLEIEADDLSHVKSKVVEKPNGTKLKIHAFKAFFGGEHPKATNKHDPDQEVSAWKWVKTRGGLPKNILKSLHVPLKDNILLKNLSFSKRAAMRSQIMDRRTFDKLFNEAMQRYAQHQSTSEKKAAKDLVPGGLADHKPDGKYPKDQLRMGRKVEMEHTDNRDLANEIAKDHLEEDKKYYSKLDKMEKGAFWKGFYG